MPWPPEETTPTPGVWPSNEMPAEVQPELTAEEKAKIVEAAITVWIADKETLEAAKNAERTSRDILTKLLFPNPKRGTNRVTFANGFSLKLVHGLNYKLGNPNAEITPFDQIKALDETIIAEGVEGRFLAERLLKLEYKFSDSEYRKLNVDNPTEKKIKELIDAMLTTEPSSPQLTLEPPKEAK